MNFSLLKLKNWVLPIVIIAFVGLTTSLLRPVLDTNTRWLLLMFLTVYVIFKWNGLVWMKNKFSLVLMVYLAWCMLTYAWSQAPSLSLMKATAFCLVTTIMISAGVLWVREHTLENSLSYLFPLTIVAVLTGVLGKGEEEAIVESSRVVMYQGLVAGPNMFGMMMAMTTPFLLWKLYRNWPFFFRRIFWGGLLLLCVTFLFLSLSRASILIVALTFSGLLLSLGLKRRMTILMLVSVVLVTIVILKPTAIDSFKRVVIYKHATDKQGVLYTRERVWKESYEYALQGGWVGGGYGVTIGQVNFAGGLSSVGYGREKGNTQLAVMEETGLIGFFIYLGLLITLFMTFGSTYRQLQLREHKVFLGIIMGATLGMVANSAFEAWWVAPGSPESAYFWCLVGIGLGFTHVVREAVTQQRKHKRHLAMRHATVPY